MPDRQIDYGEDATDATYRSGDAGGTTGGGNFVVVEDLDAGMVLFEWDETAGEFVSRGPIDLSGNNLSGVATVSATDLEASNGITDAAGVTHTGELADIDDVGDGGGSTIEVTTETELTDAETNNPAGTTVVVPSNETITLTSDFATSLRVEGRGNATIALGANEIELTDASAGLFDLVLTCDTSAKLDNEATIFTTAPATIEGCEIDGLATDTDTTDGGVGIVIGAGSDGGLKIVDNEVHDINQDGIDSWHPSDSAAVDSAVISRNEVYNCYGGDGIVLAGATGCEVNNNHVHDIGESGIVLGNRRDTDAASDNECNDNIVRDCDRGIVTTPVNTAPMPTDMTFVGNICENNGGTTEGSPNAQVWLNGHRLRWDGGIIRGGSGHGLYFEGNELEISTTVRNAGDHGIYGSDIRGNGTPQDFTISECVVSSPTNRGIKVDNAGGGGEISGCYVEGGGHNSIDIATDNVAITGNEINVLNDWRGISLFGASDCTVTGNRVQGPGTGTSTFEGIAADEDTNSNAANNNVVNSNRVSGFDVGIDDDGASDYLNVVGNNVRGNTTAIGTLNTNSQRSANIPPQA